MAYPDYKDQIQITREKAERYYARSGYSGTNIIDILTNKSILMEGTLRYIGTKIIDAKPMNLGDYNNHRGWTMPEGEDPDKWGYLVVYPDGYQSWSPREAFEEAYRQTTAMNFGLAVEAMKKGHKVARLGWNGKNMYAVLMPGYPDGIEANEVTQKQHNVPAGTTLKFRPYMQLKTAQDDIAMWSPSGSDCLADDWEIVE